jgi:hypothetical protein
MAITNDLSFSFGSQGSSQDPTGRWDDRYYVDSSGNFIYQNTGQVVARYDFNTGELTNTSGQSMGKIVTDASGKAVYTTEKGNVIPGAYSGSGGASGSQSTGSAFNLPDVSGVEGPWSTSQLQGGSYSGIGEQYSPTIAAWMAQLQKSMTPEEFSALISGAYDTARNQTAQGYEDAQNYLPSIYQQQIQPALQGAINQLASKNMINSTVGSGALAGAANMAYQSILPQQAALAGQQAELLGQLSGQEAAYQTTYPVTLGGIVSDLGKYTTQTSSSQSESRNPLAPYSLLYEALPYMAQHGNPDISTISTTPPVGSDNNSISPQIFNVNTGQPLNTATTTLTPEQFGLKWY